MTKPIDPNVITDTADAFGQARRLASKSQYPCVAWVRRDGVCRFARVTARTIKQAMLDAGTQGHMRIYDRSGGMVLNWWIANNMRRGLVRESA